MDPSYSGPIKQSLENVHDYRPISLTNLCIKFLMKILADTLQREILNCSHTNQYDFIRERTIQDCLAWTYIKCQKSGRLNGILKLEF